MSAGGERRIVNEVVGRKGKKKKRKEKEKEKKVGAKERPTRQRIIQDERVASWENSLQAWRLWEETRRRLGGD